jgi:hypothetical protein
MQERVIGAIRLGKSSPKGPWMLDIMHKAEGARKKCTRRSLNFSWLNRFKNNQ